MKEKRTSSTRDNKNSNSRMRNEKTSMNNLLDELKKTTRRHLHSAVVRNKEILQDVERKNEFMTITFFELILNIFHKNENYSAVENKQTKKAIIAPKNVDDLLAVSGSSPSGARSMT